MLLHLSEFGAPNVNMKHITGKMKFECWLQQEEGILEQWGEPELGVHLSFNVFPQRYVEDMFRTGWQDLAGFRRGQKWP